MANSKGPSHVVVDGSNIATEGRSMPSLSQLEEAVGAYMDEHPDTQVTVVVDATFAHRIDKSEAKRYEDGIANNELVAPPAGAVGRGDAFVLSIANKAGSAVLSNDSFQEFHGEYPWLFDEGRLVGGKPVPHVGWVFVARTPVRGPVSRKATRESKGSSKSSGSRRRAPKASKEASQPMPVPTAPPPAVTERGGRNKPSEPPAASRAAEPSSADDRSSDEARKPLPARGEPVNDLMPFLDFVEQHPVGTRVEGVVDAYSSHGAYLTIGAVRGYLPLRNMADPAPRSAKKAVTIGDAVELVVVAFAPARRSIDCALPVMADKLLAEAAAGGADVEEESTTTDAGTERPAEKKRASKKAAAKKTATKKTARKKTVAKKAAAKKTATKKTAAATKTATKKSAAKKTATKKAVAKKSAAKKTVAKKAAAKKTATTKSAAKKTVATKAAAKKTATTKTATRRAGTKRATKKTAASTTVAAGGGDT